MSLAFWRKGNGGQQPVAVLQQKRTYVDRSCPNCGEQKLYQERSGEVTYVNVSRAPEDPPTSDNLTISNYKCDGCGFDRDIRLTKDGKEIPIKVVDESCIVGRKSIPGAVSPYLDYVFDVGMRSPDLVALDNIQQWRESRRAQMR